MQPLFLVSRIKLSLKWNSNHYRQWIDLHNVNHKEKTSFLLPQWAQSGYNYHAAFTLVYITIKQNNFASNKYSNIAEWGTADWCFFEDF